MSCADNDSGSFVVFFLPAVVGGLTILLARRWANSQVNIASSTAVSRRRKIIKDPLIKRPLPPLACTREKMVQAGPKKAAGVTKKTSFQIPEEDSNINGKRVHKTRLSLPSTAVGQTPEIKAPDVPVAPKHIPFPYIPQDGTCLFETMTFVFTVVATGLQFLNLYRTVWWLPHSHTNQAMNFYLIDPHLVTFIIVMESRRLLLCSSRWVLKYTVAPSGYAYASHAARMFILGVILGALSWCAYFIFLKHTLVKMFYLCYPAVIYFVLFGFKTGPFMELNSDNSPLHCCSYDQQQIRSEVEVLRLDFNERIKKILFNSVVGAYYSSFLPLCFAQSYLYYDVYSTSQQVALVWGGLCCRYCCQLLSANYCDVSHRAAVHLADQARPADSGSAPAGNSGWTEWRVWPRAPAAPAAPAADRTHARFFTVFSNPSFLLCLTLCLQLSLIVLQLCLLFSSIPWHNFLSIVILLFINYYTLFKMARDYLVAWKVYKAENMIQVKNYNLTYMQN